MVKRYILFATLMVITAALVSAATSQTDEKPLSIHQKAFKCWDNPDLLFNSAPNTCTPVCEECHPHVNKLFELLETVETKFPTLYPVPDKYDKWLDLDQLQQTCRKCHENITEAVDGHMVLNAYTQDSFSFSDNYKSLEESDLRLHDNKVTCTTCHSPHYFDKALLRLANKASKLCLECHII